MPWQKHSQLTVCDTQSSKNKFLIFSSAFENRRIYRLSFAFGNLSNFRQIDVRKLVTRRIVPFSCPPVEILLHFRQFACGHKCMNWNM